MSTAPNIGSSNGTRAVQSVTVDNWLRLKYLNYTTKIEDENARNDFGISTGQFLNVLQTSGRTSWFENEPIDLALSQLIDIHERTDCYVLPTHYAAQLCHFGAGRMEQDGLPVELLTILQDERKRFIIVPCNDAMLSNLHREASSEPGGTLFGKNARDPSKNKSKASKGARQSNAHSNKPSASAPSLPLGAHWGLMIIDTQNDTARWLDGLLEIQSKEKDGNRVVYIHTMLSAGAVAGKILCGYDRLLGQDPGHFTTSTIKWTPHQIGDNTGPCDDGACGPHTFACLKHLLEIPGALEDIYAHFRHGNAAPGNFRRGRGGFNSSTTRKQISNQIREERDRRVVEPASEPSLALDADLLNILGLRVTPEAALQAVRNFCGDVIDDDPLDRSDLLQAQIRHDLEQRYNTQWLNDQQDAEMGNVLETLGINTLSKYTTWRESQKATRSESAVSGTRRIFLGDTAYNVPTNDRAIWPPHTTDKTFWVGPATELPEFSSMNHKLTDRWIRQNPGLQKKYDDLGDKANATTRRALLHHEFKKTFLGESDKDLINVWIKDSSVFGSIKKDPRQTRINEAVDLQRKAGLIRLAVMLHYEGEPAVRRVTHPRKPKSAHRGVGGGDNGKPDDNGGKGDGSNPKGPGKLPEDSDLLSDNEGDMLNEAYRENEPAGNTDPNSNGCKSNNSGGSKINDNPGFTHPLPTGLLNYPLMPEEQLELDKKKYKDKANDLRFKDKLINNSSWRAILYVDIQGGIFENDSDAVCRDVWLEDSVVFNNRDRIALSQQPTLKQTEISRRMGDHYYIRPAKVPGEPSDTSKVAIDSGSVPPAEPTTGGHVGTNIKAAAATVDVANGSTRNGKAILSGSQMLPKEPIDFRTMPFAHLRMYMTDERLNDPRLRGLKPNSTSWRAFLFVTEQGRNFEDASDDDCTTYWLQDAIVFTDADREIDWVGLEVVEFIRKRMAHHYVPDPDTDNDFNFSNSESESERGSPVASHRPSPSDVIAGPSEVLRQHAHETAQSHVVGLNEAATLLSQTVDQHLLFIDFTFDGSGDGYSPSDSTLTWPSDSPTDPDSSSDDSGPSSEGGPGKAIGKRPRGSDNDPEGEGPSLKKPRLGGSHSLPRIASAGSSENTNLDNKHDTRGQSSASNANASFSSQDTIEDETIEIYIGRQPYIFDPSDTSIFIPFDTSSEHWPAGTTELPNFSNLTSLQLNQWRRTNLDMDLPAYLGIHDYATALAMLHMKFKRTFMHESDENFTSTWINDGEVFTAELRNKLRGITDDMLRNGEIRRYMMEAYEPEMLSRVEAMPKLRLANPKITVQEGSFADPESFKSDVHVGQKPIPKKQERADGTRLSPNEARTREGRARYGMREVPKQSKKKRGSP